MRLIPVIVLSSSLMLCSCSSKEEKPQITEDTGVAVPQDTSTEAGVPGAADVIPDGEEDVSGPLILEDRPLAGRWLVGDFHVHAAGASNDASPQSTPARIKEVAVARGFDFIVLTDHSNSTGSDPWTLDEDPALYNQGPEFPFWDEVAELSDDTFILVQGNELSPVHTNTSLPTGHVGCIPRSLDDFDPNIAFVDRPRGTVTGEETIDQALEAGCLAVLNHPYGTNWISFDWTSHAYEAMEVWNGGGGFAIFDSQALDAWACDLSQGRRVTAIGGSDNHKIDVEPPGTVADPPLGVPTTYVWTETLDWGEVISSLDARRVSISDTGRPLELDVHGPTGAWLGMTGDEFDAAEGAWLRVRGELGNHANHEERRLKVYRIAPDSCDDRRSPGSIRVPVPTLDVLYDEVISQDTVIDVVLAMEISPGDAVYAFLGPETARFGGAQTSISNPVFGR